LFSTSSPRDHSPVLLGSHRQGDISIQTIENLHHDEDKYSSQAQNWTSRGEMVLLTTTKLYTETVIHDVELSSQSPESICGSRFLDGCQDQTSTGQTRVGWNSSFATPLDALFSSHSETNRTSRHDSTHNGDSDKGNLISTSDCHLGHLDTTVTFPSFLSAESSSLDGSGPGPQLPCVGRSDTANDSNGTLNVIGSTSGALLYLYGKIYNVYIVDTNIV
jgi:hypothetical protein